MQIDTDMRFFKVPQCNQLSRSIKSNKKEKNYEKNIFTIENINFYFFQNGLSEKWAKKLRHHEKNRFLNYKFCFTNFWKVLALYDHFWVTYARKLKKIQKFAHFPQILIQNSLIIQECGQIRTRVGKTLGVPGTPQVTQG